MTNTLASYISRFRKDASAVTRSLVVPVLVVEPFDPDGELDPTQSHRWKTSSAVDILSAGTDEPQVYELRKHKENAFPRGITIGRTRNNDVVIEHASVSRFHGWFEWTAEPKVWQLVDAGSKNGTMVANVKLAPKAPAELSGEAVLRFGNIHARFLQPAAFIHLVLRRAQESQVSR